MLPKLMGYDAAGDVRGARSRYAKTSANFADEMSLRVTAIGAGNPHCCGL